MAVPALLGLTGVFYLRPGVLRGTGALVGLDYQALHIRRMTFARDALRGAQHAVPGWYPHEFLGAPYAANLQSFPWIPTRLLLLLLDPSIAYAWGIALAAALAALFTYLYCRRAGLTQFGAVAAGGTFACSGYFASRVMAGHLPLLEAYPAAPLLFWLVDRALAVERTERRRFDLAALALASACVAAAGHPQVPAYALAAAVGYAIFRGRGGLRWRTIGAMASGVGLTMAAWWPMLLLIGRSTRVLHLAPTDNDVVMPYGRLFALLVPGIQGWEDPLALAGSHPFFGYPNAAYFWDTADYMGWLPLMAVAALLVGCLIRRRWPEGRWGFLTWLGVGALAGSLPLATPLLHLLPGTFFRSPARLLYLTTFCAAVALGVAVDTVQRRWPRAAGLLGLVVALHFVDLWRFVNPFILVTPLAQREKPQFEEILDRDVGDGRIAEERNALVFTYADRYDDAGGFDSILLARFDRGLMALAGLAPDLNLQEIDASELPVKALAATGVRFVINTETRGDLQLAGSTDEANLYRVPNPAPRAEFVLASEVAFAPDAQTPELFAKDPLRLLLPVEAPAQVARPGSGYAAASVAYARPSSDEVQLSTVSTQPGVVHVLESFDPGWEATVDGGSSPVWPANGFSMAVPVGSGKHEVRLVYRTPGRVAGVILSLISFIFLVALLATSAQRVLKRSPNSSPC